MGIKKSGVKANALEKFILHYRVDHDLTRIEMARQLGVPTTKLEALEKLTHIDLVLFNKLLDYMQVTEEEEEMLSEIVDKAKISVRSIYVVAYPENIRRLLTHVCDHYTQFTDATFDKIAKLLRMES